MDKFIMQGRNRLFLPYLPLGYSALLAVEADANLHESLAVGMVWQHVSL